MSWESWVRGAGWRGLMAAALLLSGSVAWGQVATSSAEMAGTSGAAVRRVSLEEAIRMAEKSEPAYAAAEAQQKIAGLDQSIARAGLLPTVTYHNQYLFTQGNGSNDRIGQTTTSAAAAIYCEQRGA